MVNLLVSEEKQKTGDEQQMKKTEFLFDKLLLMVSDKVIYFGKTSEAVNHFSTLGYVSQF